jgi:hypothetical protein
MKNPLNKMHDQGFPIYVALIVSIVMLGFAGIWHAHKLDLAATQYTQERAAIAHGHAVEVTP